MRSSGGDSGESIERVVHDRFERFDLVVGERRERAVAPPPGEGARVLPDEPHEPPARQRTCRSIRSQRVRVKKCVAIDPMRRSAGPMPGSGMTTGLPESYDQ